MSERFDLPVYEVRDKMKKRRICLEYSTISYLTARPTEEPIRKAKQILTRLWWGKRNIFDLFISESVVEEIRKGDPLIWLRKHRDANAKKYPTVEALSDYLRQFHSVEDSLADIRRRVVEKEHKGYKPTELYIEEEWSDDNPEWSVDATTVFWPRNTDFRGRFVRKHA